MSLRLALLPPGGEMLAETDGDGVHKVDVIARHRDARIAARSVTESGHVLLTLRKD